MVDSRTKKEIDVDDFVKFLKEDYGYKHIFIVEDTPEGLMAICITHRGKTYLVGGSRLQGSKAFASVHLYAKPK